MQRMIHQWKIQPSIQSRVIVIACYGLAFVALICSTVPFPLHVLLFLGLFLDSVRVIYFKLMQKLPESVVHCAFCESWWELRDKQCHVYSMKRFKNAIVWPFCVIIYFRQPKKKISQSLTVFKDTFQNPDDFRRLKFLLKCS